MPLNSNETFELWTEVGRLYSAEEAARDKHVKEQVDFPADPPSHYPKLPGWPARPGFGCRLLVQRVFHNLREAIERDLGDWRAETRAKTAQLLSVLVLHLEHEAVGHTDHILARLQMGALDAEESVVVHVRHDPLKFIRREIMKAPCFRYVGRRITSGTSSSRSTGSP